MITLPQKKRLRFWHIYQILFPSGKSYVGLTKNFENRINEYMKDVGDERSIDPVIETLREEQRFEVIVLHVTCDKEIAINLERVYNGDALLPIERGSGMVRPYPVDKGNAEELFGKSMRPSLTSLPF